MDSKICMFTGHRHIPQEDMSSLPRRIDELLDRLIADGYYDFRCGGAQGFDTIAALKVLEKKKKYPNVRLHMFLPCKDQTRGWSESARAAYSAVLERADSVKYVSETYRSGCMHARNRAMAEGSNLCVAYCRSSTGGTAYTVIYARRHGVEVQMID